MIVLHGDITYLHTIACKECGKKATSQHRINLAGVHILDLEGVIERDFANRIPDIPVSWAMYGRGNIYCQGCHKSKGGTKK